MCRCGGRVFGRRLPSGESRKEKIAPLPIKAVSVEANVVDFSAATTIRQKFANVEDTPIEAIFEFELDEKATVTDFVAIVDGVKIKGMIKEKAEAKDTYDDAIASGHGAYKMEQKEDQPNVFSVDVGNLPPGKEVDIAITYVDELQFEDGQLKFSLPSNKKNPSYAAVPKNEVPQLQLRVFFDMTSNIRSVSSPSHPISFEFGDQPTKATVTINSESAQATAANDFVILAKLAQPHQPCGRVEISDNGRKTVMAAMYPQLELEGQEDIYTELIFIVDQSGSMSGSRISQVADTLQIFLRSISEGTMFNIIGFGSSTHHLFKNGSVEYNDKNLEIATKHTQSLSACLGGTDVLKPLQEVLKTAPKPGYPRQLFILTDGEVSNTQECINFVRKHADTTRVFTFGIGNEASQHLVTGLAKAGEGHFEFIRQGDNMEEKVLRQLARAMQPALTDIKVKWKGSSKVTPAPFRFAPLFNGGRMVMYGILENDHPDCNLEVVVSAKRGMKSFEMSINVDTRKAVPGNLFHKLAAKMLLRDLDERRSYLHTATGQVKPGKNVVAESVRISLESGVLSKHTAFVAVEERDEATESTMKVRKISFDKATLQPQKASARKTSAIPAMLPTSSRASSLSRDRLGKKMKEAKFLKGKGIKVEKQMKIIGSVCDRKQRSKVSADRCLEKSTSLVDDDCDRAGSDEDDTEDIQTVDLNDEKEEKEEEKRLTTTPTGPAPSKMRDIIMKQKANGSWDWNDTIALLSISTEKLSSTMPRLLPNADKVAAESVWASAVMTAFLKKNFADHSASWNLVAQKASKFIAKNIKALSDEDLDWIELAVAFLATL